MMKRMYFSLKCNREMDGDDVAAAAAVAAAADDDDDVCICIVQDNNVGHRGTRGKAEALT